MNIPDLGLLGLASFVPVALLAQSPIDSSTPLQMGEYGIVGLTVALALWSLREQSSRRIDDAKSFAEDLKNLQESRIQESKHNHESQMTLLMRLLERGNKE